jgi:hypothetical protein
MGDKMSTIDTQTRVEENGNGRKKRKRIATVSSDGLARNYAFCNGN